MKRLEQFRETPPRDIQQTPQPLAPPPLTRRLTRFPPLPYTPRNDPVPETAASLEAKPLPTFARESFCHAGGLRNWTGCKQYTVPRALAREHLLMLRKTAEKLTKLMVGLLSGSCNSPI